MKLFKKNQVIIYVIALMLVTAGYLNYTTNENSNTIIPTSGTEDELAQMANIGDAQLVSSNDIVNETENKSNNNVINNTINNPTNAKEENTNKTVTTSFNVGKTSNSSDYFKTSKLERDTMYSQMIETYEKVLNSDNSLETQKQSATDEIKKINDTKNSIMICENLIQTKGFENSVVFVNGESVSVIIEASELSKEQVAQIQNIISREMNANAENIHISNK
jgi:stage III sporulation protein AH